MLDQILLRYYEWQTKGKEKIPYFTKHADGKVMLMAGMYHVSGAHPLIAIRFVHGANKVKTKPSQPIILL